MKTALIYLLVLFMMMLGQEALSAMVLSKSIYHYAPFSELYSKDGSLIRNVDFKSVNDLIPQIEKEFENLLKGRSLKDRGEAHITVIRPPEGRTDFLPGGIGIDKVYPTSKMINDYKNTIQETSFRAICVGMQTNKKGNIVFYLVIDSPDILNIRKDISDLVRAKDSTIPFRPLIEYYPHITIGFIGGDVHGVAKDEDSCVSSLLFQEVEM